MLWLVGNGSIWFKFLIEMWKLNSEVGIELKQSNEILKVAVWNWNCFKKT